MRAQVGADDLIGALIAAVLIAFAAAAFGLAHLRRGRDAALTAFGAFSALYGVRLLVDTDAAAVFQIPPHTRAYVIAAITYSILVPAGMFIEQVIGEPGWRSSVRRLWQAQILVAATAILADVIRGDPGGALWINPPIVVLFAIVATGHLVAARRTLRRAEFRFVLAGAAVFVLLALYHTLVPDSDLTGDLDLEPLGMVIMVAGLGHFAAQRALSNERRLATLSSELDTAREIQASIVPRTMPAIDGLRIAARYVPASSVAGDFYDFLPARGGVGLLVADVTGHGIAAALIASMLKAALAAQAEHADDPARVLSGLNHLLAGRFDRSFVTAVYAVVDVASSRLLYASAGHPPSLVRRSDGSIENLDHRQLLLGCFADVAYTNAATPLHCGDRIVFYTDGIAEAVNDADEYFGDAAFRQSIERGGGLPADPFADRLLNDVAAWTGDMPAADDVTLVVIDVVDRPG